MRSSRFAASIAVLLAAGLTVAAPASGTDPRPAATDRAPVSITTVDPATLERGPDPSIAHTDRGWFVAGDVRVKVGKYATYLGRSSGSWVVIGYRAKRDEYEVNRVAADGTVTTIRTGLDPWGTVLSQDGSRLYATDVAPPAKRTRFRVFDAVTGKRVSGRKIRGYAQVLAATRNRAYLSDDKSGTYTLNARGRKRRAVSSEYAVLIDLRNDLLETFTGDPYNKGCARVSRLSDPEKTVWKSCAERVEAFNPDGTAFATVDLLSDGIGPGLVQTRLLDGTLTGRYTTSWFGTIGWETPDTLLTVANGPTRAALVRCTDGSCENAGDTYATPTLREAASRTMRPRTALAR